jgi:uncharacterized membrane protein YeiB
VRSRPSSRLLGVDVARGVALLGMVAVHVLPDQRDDGSRTVVDLVASGRSAALFAVLAGVGVGLAYGRRPPVLRSGAALVVRALIIGAIGLALGALDSGVAVILAYYALFFVLLLPWLRAGPRVLLTSAALVAVLVPIVSLLVRDDLPERDRSSPELSDLGDPAQLLSELLLTGYYPAAAWVAYLLLGLGVARLALGTQRTALRLAVAGVVLALAAALASALLLGPLGGYDRIGEEIDPNPGFTVQEVVDESRFGNVPTVSPWWLASDARHTTTPLDLIGTAGSALLVLGMALLVAPRLRPLLTPLAAAGSMPLTLYSAHVLLLGTTDADDPETFYLGQVVVALIAATLWRRYVGRGPLEGALGLVVRPLRGNRPALRT